MEALGHYFRRVRCSRQIALDSFGLHSLSSIRLLGFLLGRALGLELLSQELLHVGLGRQVRGGRARLPTRQRRLGGGDRDAETPHQPESLVIRKVGCQGGQNRREHPPVVDTEVLDSRLDRSHGGLLVGSMQGIQGLSQLRVARRTTQGQNRKLAGGAHGGLVEHCNGHQAQEDKGNEVEDAQDCHGETGSGRPRLPLQAVQEGCSDGEKQDEHHAHGPIRQVDQRRLPGPRHELQYHVRFHYGCHDEQLHLGQVGEDHNRQGQQGTSENEPCSIPPIVGPEAKEQEPRRLQEEHVRPRRPLWRLDGSPKQRAPVKDHCPSHDDTEGDHDRVSRLLLPADHVTEAEDT
mmetsp:Transcript_74448/g.174672  ORF Transcript_74448/g.174672 Transcript_74448/m.174672 type:complete len:348 (+) Transcript_74448:343-1386(+)